MKSENAFCFFDNNTWFDFCINYEENNNTKMEFQI